MPQAFGKVIKTDGDVVTIRLHDAVKSDYLASNSDVEVSYDDGREITQRQRHKIYALLGEIDRWSGNYTMELTKRQMKHAMCLSDIRQDEFSLKNCSESLANSFIKFLVEFCFAWNVPFASKTLDEVQGNYGWEMNCLRYRKCCICGKHADIAHVHAVGIGRNRNKINHTGNLVMPLCRVHHTEQHKIGIRSFMKKYHIKGVEVTPEIAAMLKLGVWHLEKGEAIISTTES